MKRMKRMVIALVMAVILLALLVPAATLADPAVLYDNSKISYDKNLRNQAGPSVWYTDVRIAAGKTVSVEWKPQPFTPSLLAVAVGGKLVASNTGGKFSFTATKA